MHMSGSIVLKKVNTKIKFRIFIFWIYRHEVYYINFVYYNVYLVVFMIYQYLLVQVCCSIIFDCILINSFFVLGNWDSHHVPQIYCICTTVQEKERCPFSGVCMWNIYIWYSTLSSSHIFFSHLILNKMKKAFFFSSSDLLSNLYIDTHNINPYFLFCLYLFHSFSGVCILVCLQVYSGACLITTLISVL
jgi:hypothetical protein